MPDKSFIPISLLGSEVEFGNGQLAAAMRCGLPLEGQSVMDRRRVGETYLQGRSIRISTVFLGLDHSYSRSQGDFTPKPSSTFNPIMWECMVFGGVMNDSCYRTAGLYKHAKRLHVKVLKQCLSKNFDLHINDNKILGIAFDIGFVPKHKVSKTKEMSSDPVASKEDLHYDMQEFAAIDKERDQMNAFMNNHESALSNIIYHLNWSDSMYSSSTVALKGPVNTETGLCQLLVNKAVVSGAEWRATKDQEDDVNYKPIPELRPDLGLDIFVDDLTPVGKKFKSFYSSHTFQEKEIDSIRAFPDRAFVYDKENDSYYRLVGSSKYDGIVILFGKYGYFLSTRSDDCDGVENAGYNAYIDCECIEDLIDGKEKDLQEAVNIYCWGPKAESAILKDLSDAIYDRVNDDLEDPFIDPELDLLDDPLHYTCGSEENLKELCTMILQASLPPAFWDVVGETTELRILSSSEDEEAEVDYDSYEHPDLVKFLDKNNSVASCIEEALTQNEPQGHTWEYNDQARDRMSGYNKDRLTVDIVIERPTSSHLKLVQVNKLREWCTKYGLDVPDEKTIIFEKNEH